MIYEDKKGNSCVIEDIGSTDVILNIYCCVRTESGEWFIQLDDDGEFDSSCQVMFLANGEKCPTDDYDDDLLYPEFQVALDATIELFDDAMEIYKKSL